MADTTDRVNYRQSAEKLAEHFRGTFMTKDQQLLYAILETLLSRDTGEPAFISKSQQKRHAVMDIVDLSDSGIEDGKALGELRLAKEIADLIHRSEAQGNTMSWTYGLIRACLLRHGIKENEL